MAKYKDEDAIIKALYNHHFITEVNGADWFDQIMNQVIDEIKNTPAADVVEVCRCKDCKYGDTGTDEDGRQFYKCIGIHYGGVSPTDYCSYGEKRDG